MSIDTLAYAKHLPDLATKTDLDQRLEQLKHDLTVRHFGMTLGIVGLMNGILFALLRFVH